MAGRRVKARRGAFSFRVTDFLDFFPVFAVLAWLSSAAVDVWSDE